MSFPDDEMLRHNAPYVFLDDCDLDYVPPKFLGVPKESTLADGTKVSEFPGGSILIQTPLREDGWLSQDLGECG